MTIFTTLKVQQGIPLFVEKHQQRLREHAQAFRINVPKDIIQQVSAYLATNNLTDCALRITLSHNGIKLTHRLLPSRQATIAVLTVADTRDKDKIYKTTNRSVHEQATSRAKAQNADDALFVQDGMLIESPIANIFSMDETETLITPPIAGRGLNGITRQLISEHTHVIEQDIPVHTLGPLVLVNSLRIQAVTDLDGKQLIDAKMLLHKIKIIIEHAEKQERFPPPACHAWQGLAGRTRE